MIFVLAIIFWKIQFLTSTIFGADGYLHIRMAEFLKQFGPNYNFQWTQFSIFLDNFSDKDLLYHFLLIPFTWCKNIFMGAKVSTVFFFTIFMSASYFVLKKLGDKKLTWFYLLILVSPSMFVFELLRPRPFALLFTLTILALYAIIERRRKTLLVIGALYAFAHISSPYLILYVVLAELLRFFTGEKFDYKMVLYSVVGVVLGLVINPYFPANLQNLYLVNIIVPFYASKTGVLEMGAEFFPWNSRQLFLFYPILHISIWMSFFIMLCTRSKYTFKTRFSALLMLMFYIFSFISKRYATHAWPMSVIYLATFLSETDFKVFFRGAKTIVISLIGVIACCSLFLSLGLMKETIVANHYMNAHYEGIAGVMKKSIPKGKTVFHANWSDSQYFIGLNPNNNYFVTLDPVYMYHYDKEKYKLYREVAFGNNNDPYTTLKQQFNTEYGYVGRNYFSGLINQINADERFTVIAQDNLGIVFKLK